MFSRALWPGRGEALFAVVLALFAAAWPAWQHPEAHPAALAADEPALLATPPVKAAVAQDAPRAASRPVEPAPADEYRRFAPLVEEASRAHGVDAALVHAVILAESSYDPAAKSPAGAAGLMQLMPLTAKQYGVKDIFDPRQNIRAGVQVLADLLRRFNGNVEVALAAYNAGITAVTRAGNRIPPVPETQAYVPKVIDNYRRFRELGAAHGEAATAARQVASR